VCQRGTHAHDQNKQEEQGDKRSRFEMVFVWVVGVHFFTSPLSVGFSDLVVPAKRGNCCKYFYTVSMFVTVGQSVGKDENCLRLLTSPFA
jgi:hypothetical protein